MARVNCRQQQIRAIRYVISVIGIDANMDLKRLRYFVSVAEFGSFTLGARHLGIAQPALSRCIRQLENECGSPLLRRNGRGAELGNVILGMPPSVCMILVEPLFHRVRREFPGIRLHISEGFSGDVREWLVGGRLDIGVLDNSGRASNLIGQHLLVEDMFLPCAAARAESARPTVVWADALKMPLMRPGRPHGLRFLVDWVCAEAGFTPDVVLELDSMAAVKDLVRRADAATILPFCGVYRDVEQGHFVARRIVSPSITRTLIVAEAVRRPKTPATTAVVRCLREEVARLVAAGIWTGRDQDNDPVIADRSI